MAPRLSNSAAAAQTRRLHGAHRSAAAQYPRVLDFAGDQYPGGAGADSSKPTPRNARSSTNSPRQAGRAAGDPALAPGGRPAEGKEISRRSSLSSAAAGMPPRRRAGPPSRCWNPCRPRANWRPPIGYRLISGCWIRTGRVALRRARRRSSWPRSTGPRHHRRGGDRRRLGDARFRRRQGAGASRPKPRHRARGRRRRSHRPGASESWLVLWRAISIWGSRASSRRGARLFRRLRSGSCRALHARLACHDAAASGAVERGG